MEKWSYRLLDFEVFKNFEILKKETLILWGAASKGMQILRTFEHIGIHVSAFCDSDMNKWGMTYGNLTVISPYKLKKLYKTKPQICIISCIFRENELLKTFQELEIKNISFLSYWGVKTACILNGFALEYESGLPTYDDVWMYQKKCSLRSSGLLIDFLKKTSSNTSNPIWSWQPGKVASTTLEKRLKQADIPSIHLHDLTYPSHLWMNTLQTTFNSRLRNALSQRLKIITGVREPLSRDYSAFWQPFTEERAYLMPILNKNFQTMYEHYIELILKGYDYTKKTLKESNEWVWNDELKWFDEQIKKLIGIDIYQYPFDRQKGYQVICQDNIQIFIYKTEKLDNIMPMLSEFLEKDISSSENSNQSECKTYHLAYKEFRRNIRLPRNYVEHYYKNNPYMDHFYTKEEQERYLSKWKDCINE